MPETVENYIAEAPEDVREKLRLLRRTILEAVPQANERISYNMPFYEYHGRLVYFNVAKRHISLFIPSPIIDEHREDLAGYHAVQATIHLPRDQEIPVSLVQKLVKARAAKNDEADRQTSS